MRVYRQELSSLGGYLVHGANVDLGRVEAFIRKIGAFEDTIFSKRMRELRRQKERLTRQKAVGVRYACACFILGMIRDLNVRGAPGLGC